MNSDKRDFNAQVAPIHGDISRQDTVVLAHFVRHATNILEYGVGGSTYVIHDNVNPQAGKIYHLETDPNWIVKVQRGLEMFCQRIHDHEFIDTHTDLSFAETRINAIPQPEFDFIFLDAMKEYRPLAARLLWSKLTIGGVMMFHDSRQQDGRDYMFPFLDEVFNEVSEFLPNYWYSNMAVFKKTIRRDYVNWNHKEAGNNRKVWDY